MNNLYVISGVTGMTGNEVTRQLLQAGHTVLGFDNFFASSLDSVKDVINHPKFLFRQYDLNDELEMKDIECYVKANKQYFDRVIYINCAAVVHTEHFYEVEHTYETNVVSMKKFLEQAIRCKAYSFVNCSTSEVYSMQSWNANGGVKESDYLLMSTAEHSQRTSYAVGKLLTEFFMKDAVPHIFNSLLNDGKVVLLENSKKNRRSFLHNIDSCKAVLELANHDEALDGTVYNVATDEEVTIVELVKLIGAKLGIENPEIEFNGYRASDPERRILNTDKIRTRTNWKPSVTLDEGLTMCAKAYRA